VERRPEHHYGPGVARSRVPQVERWFWVAWVLISMAGLAVAGYAFTHDWSGLGLFPALGVVAAAAEAVRNRRAWRRQVSERDPQLD